jgi:hypothetical protein
VVSRDTVYRCLGTSFTFGRWLVVLVRVEVEFSAQRTNRHSRTIVFDPPAMPGPSSNVAGERQQCAKQPYASWRIGVGARDSKRFESQLLRRSRKNVVNSLRRRSSNLPGNCAKSQLWLSPELGTHRASLRGGHTENWSNSTYVAQCRLRRDHCIPRATGASRYPYVWQATDLHQHRSRGLHRPPINAHPGQL